METDLLAGWRGRRAQRRMRLQAREFLPAALEVRDTPPPAAARAILWSIMAFFVVAAAWATLGRIDVVAVAQGKILPSSRVKVIQPLETAVIKNIHVAEGQAVQRGDLLIELDPTATAADLSRVHNDLLVARLEEARLRALADAISGEASAGALETHLDSDMPQERILLARRVLESQLAEHRARVGALDRELEKQKAELHSARLDVERLAKIVPLVSKRAAALRELQERKLAAEYDYLQLERERIEKVEELALARSRLHVIQPHTLDCSTRKRVDTVRCG